MKRTFVITILLIVAITVSLYYGIMKNSDSSSSVEGSIMDYFPKAEMIKVFNGGYENAGGIDVVDKIIEDKVQIKQLSTGAGVVTVYEVTPDQITLIYASEGGEDLDEDFTNNISNRNEIILKSPIKKGTKWTDNNASYKITGVDVTVKTPAGKFKAVEVSYNSGDFQMIRYYAKDLGVVKTKVLGFDSELMEVHYGIDKIKEVNNLFKLINIYLFNK